MTIAELTISEMVVSGSIVLVLLLLAITLIGKIRNRYRKNSRDSLAPYKPTRGAFFQQPEEDDYLYMSLDADSISYLSDQNPSYNDDVDSLQSSQVDAVTEAEVYMAYDRPQQAIQVLEEEYQRRGENQGQIAIKILEIYQSLDESMDRNRSLLGFARQLNENRNQIDQEDWASIVAIVQKIDQSGKGEQQQVPPPDEGLDPLMYDEEAGHNYEHLNYKLG